MSDTTTQGNNRRRRNRGGRNRSGQGPRPGSTPRAGHKEPTGLQKFLSVISFGLLGKPKALPRAAQPQSRQPQPSNGSRNESPRPPREPKPRREPQQVNPADITTERLYVGNLSYDATESDLFELFSGVGSVRNCEVVVNNRTQRSKGFAFVTMSNVEEARRAVQELSGKDFMSRALQLSGAKPIAPGDRRESED
ncbi:RNA recognition motif. (a.k.a. RRM, RBD, or RNP domain) [Prosthecobacter debontii]|uniref:RNA recognition motif. (A.k.a. RRM, RBD, or RNP domain) n=1 Tax=Prosthecobacter debontii TaxID=48467 RepID=A0A1T4Y815_9BACT|nr:RNA-binding protein [Prosthecobacter debontii]SKA97972.1 RNA recognition motif. (a.k.a. RRM, RBD, or RNP domain) [Prosthecobacter debontii]